MGNDEIETLHIGRVDPLRHIETQTTSVVNLDGPLPKQLYNVHHFDDILAQRGGGIDIGGVIVSIEAYGSVF